MLYNCIIYKINLEFIKNIKFKVKVVWIGVEIK